MPGSRRCSITVVYLCYSYRYHLLYVAQELPDPEGRPYYYNTQTGVSQWEKPVEMA